VFRTINKMLIEPWRMQKGRRRRQEEKKDSKQSKK